MGIFLLVICLSFYLSNGYDMIFHIPLLYSIVLPLANPDLITTRYKYQAFLISAMLSLILFYFSIFSVFALGMTFIGEFSYHFVCCISGILFLLINAIFIKINNLKIGLIIITLFSLAAPFITTCAIQFPYSNISKEDIIVIIFQILIGLALSIAVSIKIISNSQPLTVL